MNILIVGAKGQLGQELVKLFPEAKAVDLDELDITDAEAVKNFDWAGIEIIINAAAYTNVDGAEDPANRAVVWAANATAVKNLAAIAEQKDLTLAHVSTDYVFDGTKPQPYSEDDRPNPQSEYGKSKAAGDGAAAKVPKHYIVRTSWVIGKGKNFVRTMLELGKARDSVSVVNDQRGRPTFAGDLAAAIKYLLETKPEAGLYNFSNEGPVVSWFEFTRKVFELANVKCAVKAITTEEFAKGKDFFAPRPTNSSLNLAKIKATGLTIRDWEDALAEYLRRLRDESR